MSPTKEQTMERNLSMAETHLLRILERPQLLNGIPDGAHVVLLPVNDQELLETNLKAVNHLVRKMSGDGSREPVILVLLPMEEKELALA
jgi:hypothetical protein